MQYEKAVEGVVSPKDLSSLAVSSQKIIHNNAKRRADELLRGLAWDDLMLLSMVDWIAVMEIRATEGREILERIQKHLAAPFEPMSEP